jgi:hypothetical protein
MRIARTPLAETAHRPLGRSDARTGEHGHCVPRVRVVLERQGPRRVRDTLPSTSPICDAADVQSTTRERPRAVRRCPAIWRDAMTQFARLSSTSEFTKRSKREGTYVWEGSADGLFTSEYAPSRAESCWHGDCRKRLELRR